MVTIKVLFRSKCAAKSPHRKSFKIFTNVRVPGNARPKQIHLGYVPTALPCLPPFDRERLTQKLKTEWVRLFGNDAVEIDWVDAEQKWQRRNEHRQWKVDRQKALAHIQAWFKEDETFAISYLKLYQYLAPQIKGYDPLAIALWWEFEAAPGLLFRYQKFAKRKGIEPCPNGFLGYLRGNIRLGYAVKDFLRTKGEPQNAPRGEDLTGSYAGEESELNHEWIEEAEYEEDLLELLSEE